MIEPKTINLTVIIKYIELKIYRKIYLKIY